MITRALAGAAAATVLLAAPAAAYPVKGVPELTHNDLYKVGKLPKVACKLEKGTTKASTVRYLTKLVDCFNKAWKPAVPDYQPVEVEIKDRYESHCHTGVKISGSFAAICGTQIEIQLGADWIKAKNDLPIVIQVADAFAGVVQGQTGIGEAYWGMPNDADEKQLEEQSRRFSMQQDCLAGVGVKALGRTAKNWKPLLRAETPQPVDEYYRKWFPTKPTANELYWFTRGYKTGDPGACNTWKAPEAKVA
ncbi:hypothetical protein [Thermoactinospora rubra]|uniref:hypothetical protein n=1 Tax=Thermoactinospora rubra TaxID=1088767 RepID=UPI00117E0365|nr:hypothetical protein [Thermoactinospora rubra]